MEGLLVVDKPSGPTSHTVVARVRRLAGLRRVGHAGTLDPMATGVLVLGLGRATRLLGHLALDDKEYRATIRLGIATITDDADGEATAVVDASGIAPAQVEAALPAFTGDVLQVPSAVSAIKVDGRRSYARVRAGEDVELAARPVRIARFDLLDARPVVVDGVAALDVDVVVECSTGTYVRALARDLGNALGVGGHLTMLRRTRSGAFDVAAALRLDDATTSDDVRAALVGLDEAVARCFPLLRIAEEHVAGVLHGRPLPLRTVDASAVEAAPPVRPFGVLAPDGRALALMERRGDELKPVVVFA